MAVVSSSTETDTHQMSTTIQTLPGCEENPLIATRNMNIDFSGLCVWQLSVLSAVTCQDTKIKMQIQNDYDIEWK